MLSKGGAERTEKLDTIDFRIKKKQPMTIAKMRKGVAFFPNCEPYEKSILGCSHSRRLSGRRG
jgi:hypothetical protein